MRNTRKLRSLLRAVFGGEPCRPRSHPVLPRLEGLEERWTPANLGWSPQGGSTDWLVGSNWVDLANSQRRTDAPSGSDTVIFDGSTSNGDCSWSQPLSAGATLCHSLLVQGDYAGNLSINTSSSTAVLNITDELSIAGNFAFDLDLGAGNKIAVGGELYWTGQGGVDRSDANALATIDAHHIHWVGESKALGANVTTTGPGSASTINLDEPPGVGGEYTLFLDKGAVLENGAGTLTHNSGKIDDTSHVNHESSHVSNASGATWTKTTDTTTTVSMTFANAGLFRLEAGTYLIDDYSSAGYSVGYYEGPTGTTQIESGASLQSTGSSGNSGDGFAGNNLLSAGDSEAELLNLALPSIDGGKGWTRGNTTTRNNDGTGDTGQLEITVVGRVTAAEAIDPDPAPTRADEGECADQDDGRDDAWKGLGGVNKYRLAA